MCTSAMRAACESFAEILDVLGLSYLDFSTISHENKMRCPVCIVAGAEFSSQKALVGLETPPGNKPPTPERRPGVDNGAGVSFPAW